MQWRYVIGIPRDLFFNIAVKVKPFSFFSSTTVKIRWLLKSVRAIEQKKLCAMLISIFWRSNIIHGLPFCNSKKYIIIFISYDGRPCRPLKHVNSWHCCAGKLPFLGIVSSFLQRSKFPYQVQNYKAMKYAREFSLSDVYSHTRASKSKQSCKTTKE